MDVVVQMGIFKARHVILNCAAKYNLHMTQEARELLQKALALTENERAELAGNLISSLDTVIDLDTDAAWQQEAARRLQQVEAGIVTTVPWAEVQKKGRAALDGK